MHGARRGTTGLCIELHGYSRNTNSRNTVTPETRAFFCGGRPCPDKRKATVMSNDNGESEVTPTESETTCTVENLSRASRETPAISVSCMEADRSEKVRCHNADMYVAGRVFFRKGADGSMVPEKQTNKAGTPVAESVENREQPEGMLCGFALISDPAPSL